MLPAGAKILERAARLGHETVGHRPVAIRAGSGSSVVFEGKEPMEADESFVVTLAWEKGAVASDGSERRLLIYEAAFWGFALAVLAFCWFVWRRHGKDGDAGTVMPLFAPPKREDGAEMSPAEMSFVANALRFTSRGFTALLASLAQKGHLRLGGAGRGGRPGGPRAEIQHGHYPSWSNYGIISAVSFPNGGRDG